MVCPTAMTAVSLESVLVLGDDRPEVEVALNKRSSSRGQWCTAVCIKQSLTV